MLKYLSSRMTLAGLPLISMAFPFLMTRSRHAKRRMRSLWVCSQSCSQSFGVSHFGYRVGSVGGPKWGVGTVRPEQGLLKLRKELGVYANIRPCSFASESLLESSPLRPEIARGTDIIVVRELIGGVYFGERQELASSSKQGEEADAWDTMSYSIGEVKRITRVAAQIALAANPPLPLHSVDKANVLASSRLWRKIVTETIAEEFPTVALDHHLVDSAAMLIVASPRKLNGVVLTENLFGDM